MQDFILKAVSFLFEFFVPIPLRRRHETKTNWIVKLVKSKVQHSKSNESLKFSHSSLFFFGASQFPVLTIHVHHQCCSINTIGSEYHNWNYGGKERPWHCCAGLLLVMILSVWLHVLNIGFCYYYPRTSAHRIDVWFLPLSGIQSWILPYNGRR